MKPTPAMRKKLEKVRLSIIDLLGPLSHDDDCRGIKVFFAWAHAGRVGVASAEYGSAFEEANELLLKEMGLVVEGRKPVERLYATPKPVRN